MAVQKLTTDEAEKLFNRAEHFAKLVLADPNDPASANLISAMDHYAASAAAALNEVISGINDLLERVDRIEQKLKK